MPETLWQVFKDEDAVARASAEVFVNMASQASRPFRVALAGGTTPKTLYALLASPPYRNRVVWDHVSFFFGDERAVPPDHADSNYRSAEEALFRPLGIPDQRIFRMKGEWTDLEAAAVDYEQMLRSVFIGEHVPCFDLVLLGMGPDGHTAALFPRSPALAEWGRWVVAVTDAPKPPPRRLTLTVPVFNAAKLVLFMVTGSDKAEALREVLQGTALPDFYPAKHVRPAPQCLGWFVDAAAARSLQRRQYAGNG